MPWPDDIPAPPLRPHSSPDAFAALIAGAGFAAATARLLSWEHRVARHAVDAGQVALPAVAVLGSGQRTAPE